MKNQTLPSKTYFYNKKAHTHSPREGEREIERKTTVWANMLTLNYLCTSNKKRDICMHHIVFHFFVSSIRTL